MSETPAIEQHPPAVLVLKMVLLSVWAGVSFGVCFFARDLQFWFAGWPFAYWMAAQGSLVAFIAIVAIYAAVMRRLAPEDEELPGA